jgi:Tol biopolymer transport system component
VSQSPSGKGRYLDSWKEIAAYLNRNVRTCWLWERELGLPVHRLDGSPKARVFAYTAELDAWRDAKGQLPDNAGSGTNGSEVGEEAKKSSPERTITVRRSTRTWLAAALLAGPALAAVSTWLIVRHPHQTSPSPVGRFTIKVEPGYWLDGIRRAWEMELPSRTAMAVSSDGRFVVYSAIEENPGPEARPRLFLRRIDRSEATPITGTEGAMAPFLSPDNRWVGFVTGYFKLKRVPVEGGVPTPICDLGRWINGASWGLDNTIVFGAGEAFGLYRVSAEGGKPEILSVPDPKREEISHRLPFWLPDGKTVIFTVMRHTIDRQPWLVLLRMDTREWRVLLQDGADARYIPTGYLVFIRQGTLMAVRFDLAKLEAVGQPVALVRNVSQGFSTSDWFHTAAGQFGVSSTGSLVYASESIVPEAKNSLEWVDQMGRKQPAAAWQLPVVFHRLSPDGQRIAYGILGRKNQIWVYDLRTGANGPLTDEGVAFSPIWSPDGRRLIFSWERSLVQNLFWQPYDGSAAMVRLTTSRSPQYAGSWSPDGTTVAFVETPWLASTAWVADIAMLDVRSGRVTPFLNSPWDEFEPEFSPDGRWLAYASNEPGPCEVFVRAFPGPGSKHQVSSGGGTMPLWSRDGKQLFYRLRDEVWAVDVSTGGDFKATKPRLLFRNPEAADWEAGQRTYDVSIDGRFLMVKGESRKPQPLTEMVLVQNWFEEIKRLDPYRKK